MVGVGKIGSDSAYMSRADDLHRLFESEGLGWMNGAIPFQYPSKVNKTSS